MLKWSRFRKNSTLIFFMCRGEQIFHSLFYLLNARTSKEQNSKTLQNIIRIRGGKEQTVPRGAPRGFDGGQSALLRRFLGRIFGKSLRSGSGGLKLKRKFDNTQFLHPLHIFPNPSVPKLLVTWRRNLRRSLGHGSISGGGASSSSLSPRNHCRSAAHCRPGALAVEIGSGALENRKVSHEVANRMQWEWRELPCGISLF